MNQNPKKLRKTVYLKAARWLHKPPDYEPWFFTVYTCHAICAVLKMDYIDRPPERKAYEWFFELEKQTFGYYEREPRLIALCLMAAVVEAGDVTIKDAQ